MKTLHRRLSSQSRQAVVETLENRSLLSAVVRAPVDPVSISPVAANKIIHAEVDESFTAVVGSLAALPPVAVGYSLSGSIDWGDGTADSPVRFVRQASGGIALLGSHTYSTVGNDNITVTVVESPPSNSAAPIIVLQVQHNEAVVITSPGGVTLSESAGRTFTANVGTFSSSLSDQLMTATINWGDGTTSLGKILALPVASPSTSPIAGGTFAVVGNHTYAQTGSYLVHVTVTASLATNPTGPTPDYVILVAQIDSVIDVLPALPTITPFSPIVLV